MLESPFTASKQSVKNSSLYAGSILIITTTTTTSAVGVPTAIAMSFAAFTIKAGNNKWHLHLARNFCCSCKERGCGCAGGGWRTFAGLESAPLVVAASSDKQRTHNNQKRQQKCQQMSGKERRQQTLVTSQTSDNNKWISKQTKHKHKKGVSTTTTNCDIDVAVICWCVCVYVLLSNCEAGVSGGVFCCHIVVATYVGYFRVLVCTPCIYCAYVLVHLHKYAYEYIFCRYIADFVEKDWHSGHSRHAKICVRDYFENDISLYCEFFSKFKK